MNVNDILRIVLVAVFAACAFLPGFRIKVSSPVQITEAEETEDIKTQQPHLSLEDAMNKKESAAAAFNRAPSAIV
jgi:hypothetical protein